MWAPLEDPISSVTVLIEDKMGQVDLKKIQKMIEEKCLIRCKVKSTDSIQPVGNKIKILNRGNYEDSL